MLSYATNFSAENRKLSDIYNKSNLSFQTFFVEFMFHSGMVVEYLLHVGA